MSSWAIVIVVLSQLGLLIGAVVAGYAWGKHVGYDDGYDSAREQFEAERERLSEEHRVTVAALEADVDSQLRGLGVDGEAWLQKWRSSRS